MTPEAKARQLIDQKLELAGWTVQDMKLLNLGGIAWYCSSRISY